MSDEGNEVRAAGDAEIRLSYARLFNDNPQAGDGKRVLADLMNFAGWQGAQSIAAFNGNPAAYEISCHENNGRRAVYQRVTSFAALTEDEMLGLELIVRRAARM